MLGSIVTRKTYEKGKRIESGRLLYRFVVPAKLRAAYGQREVLVSLHTSDKEVARQRALGEAGKVAAKLRALKNGTALPEDDRVSIVVNVGREREVWENPEADVLLSLRNDAREQGETAKADRLDAALARAEGRFTVTELVEAWATAKLALGKSPRGVAGARVMVAGLVKVCGPALPASKVTDAHVSAWLRALETEPSAKTGRPRDPATVRTVYATVGAIFKWAAHPKRKHIAVSPFFPLDAEESVKVKHEHDKGFTDEELRAIFAHALYRAPILTPNGGTKGVKVSPAARYWLPVIGLWTGMRSNEIAGLRASDVKTAEGVTFFDVVEHEGRSLKNKSSRRRIPVHSALVKAGLLAYVDAVKASGADRLFDGLTSGNYSAAFGELRDSVGVKGKVFHSFRHGWKTAARRCGVEEQYSDAMTGHVNGSVGRTYGLAPLPKLAEQMERITFEGITLPTA
jgi:integrase